MKDWLRLAGLTCAAFVFNTSEFVPIGLLSDIATDFAVTEARAGLIISVYAWIVMLLSLPLMLLVSKMELRRLLLGVMALFIGFQFLSGASTGYSMLMLSRAGVACTHAIFWSIISPLAVRLVPDRFRALALSMVVTGTSVAMIFGLPLGRVIGLHIGWRMTFSSLGAFSLLVLFYLSFLLPQVPSRGRFSLGKLPELLKSPLLVGMYVLSLSFATAYYTGYSYIEPFLKQVAGMADGSITATLMLFGGAGILGSLLFSKCYAHSPFRFLTLVLAALAACLLLLHAASRVVPAVVLLCALWGVAATAFSVAMQSEIIRRSPACATSVSMSIFSGIFNLGIGCGTFVGGVVCTRFSLSGVGYAGGLLAVFALLFWRSRLMGLFARAGAGQVAEAGPSAT